MTATLTDFQGCPDVDVDRIISELDSAGDKLPEKAIREAQQHRDVMVPKLISVLRRVTAEAREGRKPKGDAQFFALFLLAEFRAHEALPAVLEAVTLPGDLSYDLFGDAMTSSLPRVFVALAEDPVALIETLIPNRELDEYLRWGAADCYCLLVRDGCMERSEAVERLGAHLRDAIDNEDCEIAGPLVSVLESLYPREAYDVIAEAFRCELVDEFLVSLEDIDAVLAAGERESLARLNRHGLAPVEDTVEELSKWVTFRKKPREAERRPAEPIPDPVASNLWPEEAGLPDSQRPRAGRNDPCPCGSGKKFKKCCGSPQARRTT